MDEIVGPMRLALELAWESACAGSLGIGAVITNQDGHVVATGRNRIAESHPGDDVLAGTSLAHAELNALAKLRWRAHANERLTLWTTLDPCLQCAGAIRMARISEVRVLAPDPLFRNMNQMRELNAQVAARWPDYHSSAPDPLAAFSLLLQTHALIFLRLDLPDWTAAMPRITTLARELAMSGELIALAGSGAALDGVLAALWARLSEAVPDVADLWQT